MDINPYQSPNPDAPPFGLPADTVFYKTRTTKLTVAECWRLAKNPFEFSIAFVFKLLRIPLPMNFAFANSSQLLTVAPEQVPQDARQSLAPLVDQAQALGLQYSFTYMLPTVGNVTGVAAALRTVDGRVVLPIVYAKTWVNHVVDQKLTFAFATRMKDGRVLITSGTKREMNSPDHMHVEYHPRLPMAEVFQRHLDRIKESVAAPVIVSEHEMVDYFRQFEGDVFSYQIERGVYEPVSGADLARYQQDASPDKSAGPATTKGNRLQILELICWVSIGLGTYFVWKEPAVNQAQAVFRYSLIAAGGLGAIGIWLFRTISNRQS